MARFLIKSSFSIELKNLFVFSGDILEGEVVPGMVFEVPEAGHRWKVRILSVERACTDHGAELALTVEDDQYLPGLGVGWTADVRHDSAQAGHE